MRNSVPTSRAISEPTSGAGAIPEQKLSAALRAQACGVGPGSPLGFAPHPRPAGPVSSGRGPAHAKPGPSALMVLILAALLGAMAGGLAGVISIW
ncbi:MAG: hypothetical protein WCF33_05810 [Pseudonocardiaceae bacterium]